MCAHISVRTNHYQIVMSDRNLCLSFMQSTRSLELGTGSDGPATKICDLQKTSPSPPHHQSPLRNVIRMDPKDWQRHTSNKPFVPPTSFPGAGQASNNDLVAMWYPQVTSYSPTIETLATKFLSSLRAALVLFCTSSHHQVRR